MAIAGFDPSLTHFGWVLLDENKEGKDSLLNSGVFQTNSSENLLIQRLIFQKERVRKLIRDNKISFVSMEAPYFGDFNTELLFAMNQFIHEVFLDEGVYVIYFPPQSLKKMAIPSMDPKDVTKNHMIHFAKTDLGMHGQKLSEHVADAYFAGKVGSRFYKWNFLKQLKDEDLTEDERNSFCGKRTFKKGVRKGLTEYTGIIYRENDQFFDYSKQKLKTKNITKEVQGGS
jgi:Holliday junction resolvasome RuvABC endonuclease subunit